MEDVSRKMVHGAVWMIVARVLDRLIGLASTVILVRILVPADFGLLAMATSIIAMLALLGDFSFDLALIQNPKAERRHYDTVWTLNLLFSIIYALMLVLLAQPAAHFYHEPRLAAGMEWLALGTLLGGFTNVGIVAFRKEMRFDKEFTFLLSKRLAGFIVTVVLALLWRDYWALVGGTLTVMIVGVALSFLLQSYRPRFSLEARTELFRFSRWLFANNTLGFLYHRAADFILAKGVGSEGLGYYSVAYEISNLPSSELVAPANRAVFPGYAKVSTHAGGLRQGFINVISVLALLAIPAAVGLACIADPIVNVFLGPKWLSTIPLIQVLAINGVLTAILSCSGYVYVAIGKPRNVTLLLAAHVSLAVPMIAWGASYAGIGAVAWALLCASLLVFPLNYLLLSAALKVTAADLLKVLWRPTVGAAVMAALIIWANRLGGFQIDIAGEISGLLVLVIYGAVAYGIVIAVLWRLSSSPAGAEAFLLDKFRKVFSLRRAI